MDGILRDARGKFENTWAAAEGMVMTLGEQEIDVVIPAAREGLRREAHFRARVSGVTQEGRAFEEETVIRDLSLAWCADLPGPQPQAAVRAASHYR